MDKACWIDRKHEAMAAARAALSSEARLYYYDMAGRHSVRAANCPPFLLVEKGPTTPGEAEALGISRHASIFHIQPPHPRAPRPPGKTGGGGWVR
jgi:hypothetical protein